MTRNTQIALFAAFVIAVTLACVDLALSEQPLFGMLGIVAANFYTYQPGTFTTPVPRSQRRGTILTAVIVVTLTLGSALSGLTLWLNKVMDHDVLRMCLAPFVWLALFAGGWSAFRARLRASDASAQTPRHEPT